jgi:hypothetical protein
VRLTISGWILDWSDFLILFYAEVGVKRILFYACPIAMEPLIDLALNILELEFVQTSEPIS